MDNISKRKNEDKDYDLQHPDDSLAEHLLTLYWQGEISIDDPTSLIGRFFDKAPDLTRRHAIDFAGRTVWKTEVEIPKEVLVRLQHLFDSRLTVAKASNRPAKFEKELSAFGVWVHARKFDEHWTLHALEEMLTLTKTREGFGGFVLEALAELSKRLPLEATRCLKLMIASDQERLSWYAQPEKLKSILRNALAAGNESAKKTAIEVQDSLVRQGWFEFRSVD